MKKLLKWVAIGRCFAELGFVWALTQEEAERTARKAYGERFEYVIIA